jgi:hypothetical protein
LQVGRRDVNGVERWWVIVKDSEKIIVIVKEVLFFVAQLRSRESMGRGGNAQIRNGSEERGVGGGRFVADWRWSNVR